MENTGYIDSNILAREEYHMINSEINFRPALKASALTKTQYLVSTLAFLYINYLKALIENKIIGREMMM